MAGDQSVVKAFDCPNCGANITIKAVGFSVSVGCPSCGTVIDANNENYQNILRMQGHVEKYRQSFYIPLNAKGELLGDRWEVVGAMVRSDADAAYFWRDYLLFNPYQGYRFLNEFDGHWNFFRPVKRLPDGSPGRTRVFYGNSNFDLFNAGKSVVRFVVGEFYWRVQQGDVVDTFDYVCPPLQLSAEVQAMEIDWSLGKYIEATKIQQAFNLEDTPPPRLGVGANQPYDSANDEPIGERARSFIGFVSVLIIMQIIGVLFSSNKTVLEQKFQHMVPSSLSSESAVDHISNEFQITGRLEPIEYILSADILNNWLSTDVTLVNLDTGHKVAFQYGVEYYRGSGWSEGQKKGSLILPPVPAGNYRINLKSSSQQNHPRFSNSQSFLKNIPPSRRSPIEFRLTVKKGVARWSNFLICLLLLALPFCWGWWRRRQFEVQRWSNSDYSPYWTEEE